MRSAASAQVVLSEVTSGRKCEDCDVLVVAAEVGQRPASCDADTHSDEALLVEVGGGIG